jgi:hypothetical protein
MKKRLTLLVFASFLLFQGASPWEGSAAVAPNGDLPSTGFYIATNAFPRNTVVDITNIETGKSTRVIVSNTLTSPGLLAVVSREAAQLIGMRAGSISRIRMIQPSDPMAYMRFTESMTAGIPEYDSGDVIDEENLVADVYDNDAYSPVDTVNKTAEAQRTPPTVPGYIVDEPEWGGNGKLQIVDVPGYMVEPEEHPEPAEDLDHIVNRDRDPVIHDPLYITEEPKKDIIKDVSPKTDEKPPIDIEKDTPVFITEAPRDEVVKDVSPWQEKVEVVTPSGQPETITQAPPGQQILVPVETAPNPPPSVYGINPEDIIPGIVIATPERQATVVNDNKIAAADPNFPVKTIDRLDRGKYYVQVAAQPENLVENMLNQIDRSFAPVVFKGTDNIYRILIGPLNQGESAAVLARFKSIGYKDAFVRMGG